MATRKSGTQQKTASRKSSSRSRSPAKRKKTASKKRAKPRKTRRWLVLTVCLGVTIGVAVVLLLPRLLPQRPVPTPLSQKVKIVDQVLLAQFYQLDIPQKNIQMSRQQQQQGQDTWSLSQWKVNLPRGVTPQDVTAKLRKSMRQICPEVLVVGTEGSDDTWEMRLRIDDMLTHHLILRRPKIKPPKPKVALPKVGLPLVAIVVDDLGLDERVAGELLSLDAPLTFSILPLRQFSRSIAQRAREQGREVILHLPMEPRSYPSKDPGSGALFVSMDDGELLNRLTRHLEAFPFVKGVNNHMGSRFMENEQKVKLVLKELKKRDLFFLDSLTTSNSKGYRIAQELAMRGAKRDVFLDNETGVEDVERQLRRLMRIAKRRGVAIGICHPYPTTIAALREMIPKIRAEGLEIVPLSQAID